MKVYYQVIENKVLKIHVYSDETHLRGIFFDENHSEKKRLKINLKALIKAPSKVILEFKKQINEYLAGQRFDFDIPFQFDGTDLQKQAWKALLKIKYGKTLSYKEQSEKIGKPKAFRAVASANGRNLFPILIPCHRVISSNGSLGGYSGGLELKTILLQLENKNHS